MDLKGGQVVHAIGGRRNEYRPIRSPLAPSPCPVDLACALRDNLKLVEIYVADLDAIAGAMPAWGIYRTLAQMNLRLMVDAGIRDVSTAKAVLDTGASSVVIGLETTDGPKLVRDVVSTIAKQAIWFSLDLKNGEPLGNLKSWPGNPASAESIAAEVVSAGVTRLIVLDLARVGQGAGTGTEPLCRRLLHNHSDLELVAGGGIRDQSDLDRLAAIGLSGALVATALHEGRVRP
jgi:phosphoribosylformimino-5-aminoimidazole carboxamide ribotide isomerase